MPDWIGDPKKLLPIAIGVLVLLLAVLGFLQPEKKQVESFANRSVHNNAASGSKAWYLTEQRSGTSLNIWVKPFDALNQMPVASTMVLLEPYTVSYDTVIFNHSQVHSVLQWAAAGNTVVLLDDFQGHAGTLLFLERLNRHLAQPLEVFSTVSKTILKQAEAVSGDNKADASLQNKLGLHAFSSPKAPGLPTNISMIGSGPVQIPVKQLGLYQNAPVLSHTPFCIRAKGAANFTPQTQVLLQRSGCTGMVRVAYGKGYIILGTTTDLVSNPLLNEKPRNDNYQWFSNLLHLEGKPVFVNEYVHGEQDVGSLASYYQQRTPLGAMLNQLILAFLFLLWLSFTRWQPPSQLNAGNALPGNGLTRYIDSLAILYSGNQAACLPLEAQLQAINTQLRSHYRIFSLQDPAFQTLVAELSHANANKAIPLASLLKACQRASRIVETQGRLPHGELLRLSRALSHLQDLLRPEIRSGL